MERVAILPLLAAACVAAACADREGLDDEPTVLRVGTSHGLGEFAPGDARMGGAAYYVHELLYEPVTAFAEICSVQDRTLTMVAEDGARAELLAEHLTFEGLEGVEIAGERMVMATFSSASVAEGAAQKFEAGQPAVATGPFRAVSSDQVIRLQAQRHGLQIDAIEIRSLDTTELWRRLHGRDIDVIPVLDEMHREQFEGMPSVRTVELPPLGSQSLIFNTGASPLADQQVRYRLAELIDRQAIAHVACGSADCAADFWLKKSLPEIARSGDEVSLPAALELVVLESDSAAVLAAGVLRHQLRRHGVRLQIKAAPIEDLLSPELRGYDLILLPLSRSPRRAAWQLNQLQLLDVGQTKYARARASGSDEAWQRVFEAELPALPLYSMRSFAAIDGRFCGGSALEHADSWRWLADLHPCEVASR